MWQLARNPLPHKAIHDGKNRIWYYLMWAYGDECDTRGSEALHNLESSRHLPHHAKDYKGDGSSKRAAARE